MAHLTQCQAHPLIRWVIYHTRTYFVHTSARMYHVSAAMRSADCRVPRSSSAFITLRIRRDVFGRDSHIALNWIQIDVLARPTEPQIALSVIDIDHISYNTGIPCRSLCLYIYSGHSQCPCPVLNVSSGWSQLKLHRARGSFLCRGQGLWVIFSPQMQPWPVMLLHKGAVARSHTARSSSLTIVNGSAQVRGQQCSCEAAWG